MAVISFIQKLCICTVVWFTRQSDLQNVWGWMLGSWTVSHEPWVRGHGIKPWVRIHGSWVKGQGLNVTDWMSWSEVMGQRSCHLTSGSWRLTEGVRVRAFFPGSWTLGWKVKCRVYKEHGVEHLRTGRERSLQAIHCVK